VSPRKGDSVARKASGENARSWSVDGAGQKCEPKAILLTGRDQRRCMSAKSVDFPCKKLILGTQTYGLRTEIGTPMVYCHARSSERRLQRLWCCGKESTSGCGKVARAKTVQIRGENEAKSGEAVKKIFKKYENTLDINWRLARLRLRQFLLLRNVPTFSLTYPHAGQSQRGVPVSAQLEKATMNSLRWTGSHTLQDLRLGAIRNAHMQLPRCVEPCAAAGVPDSEAEPEAQPGRPVTDKFANQKTVENIGQRIRQLRESRGMTQSQLQQSPRSRVPICRALKATDDAKPGTLRDLYGTSDVDWSEPVLRHPARFTQLANALTDVLHRLLVGELVRSRLGPGLRLGLASGIRTQPLRQGSNASPAIASARPVLHQPQVLQRMNFPVHLK